MILRGGLAAILVLLVGTWGGAAGAQREIRIMASQFAFDPPRVRVALGDRIILRVISQDVTHGIYVDGYGLTTKAFPSREVIQGRRVLLVGEVPTSGHTLRHASEALLHLGAREVRTLVLFAAPHGVRTDYSGPEATMMVLQPWIREVAIVDAGLVGVPPSGGVDA